MRLADHGGPLSRRKLSDMVHCLDHLCGVVSLFFHRNALEFKTDVETTALAHVMFALLVGKSPLVSILDCHPDELADA